MWSVSVRPPIFPFRPRCAFRALCWLGPALRREIKARQGPESPPLNLSAPAGWPRTGLLIHVVLGRDGLEVGVVGAGFPRAPAHFQERALVSLRMQTCTRAHAILHTQACLLAGAHKRTVAGPDCGPRHRGRAWLEPSPLLPEVGGQSSPAGWETPAWRAASWAWSKPLG